MALQARDWPWRQAYTGHRPLRSQLPPILTIRVCDVVSLAQGAGVLIPYNVALQTREIAIRMARGAQSIPVVGLVLQKGTRLILAGMNIGVISSYFLTRLIASEVWGVSLTDPATFASVAFLAVLLGLLACLFPARPPASIPLSP